MTCIIGLTGGIGSGKSTVSTLFAELGVSTIDADEISRTLSGPGSPLADPVARIFGRDVLTTNRSLDRAALRAQVFNDPRKLSALEAILHPAILAQADEQLAKIMSPYVLFAVPLLARTPTFLTRTQRVLFVHAPEHLRSQRILARSGIDATLSQAIMAQQPSEDEMRAIADDVLENTGSHDELRRAVIKLHQQYCNYAATYQH
ncbi:dephospho-CoA kinase [Chitinibacteraceae bacterium HSL-7]